jgi:hypothetical protein
VLRVVYRTISGHLRSGARLGRRTGHTGAVALIQRIALRLGRMPERRGLIERDAEGAWLGGETLGAASEGGVRDRDRDLCPLKGSAACDREHRGAGSRADQAVAETAIGRR